MKKIAVLFTQKHDWFSKFLVELCRHKYSHVSLSLDENECEFYSFNVKGFVRETYEKFRRHNVRNSMLYEIEVNDHIYETMQKKMDDFKARCKEMRYSFLGVAFCCLHIPLHLNQQYFCSEFVAELLAFSHAVSLQKKPEQYLPEQLRMELDRCAGIYRLANVV